VDIATATALAKYLGAGFAMIGAIGAGIGIGLSVGGAVQAMGRNPDAAPLIQTNMILGVAFAEAIGIFCLVVSLILLFVVQA
jgi:ATP synthase F0 subunit c